MTKVHSVLYDVDDLWCENQIVDYLVPLYEANPAFRVTAYSIPNKLGPVTALREKYPWIVFAQHGWEHVPFECRTWTEDDAEWYIKRALEMGYAKLFKPPNWTWDDETMKVIERLGLTFHHHPEDKQIEKWVGRALLYPGPKASRTKIPNFHTHIHANPVTDHISTHRAFTAQRVKEFESFSDPMEEAQ